MTGDGQILTANLDAAGVPALGKFRTTGDTNLDAEVDVFQFDGQGRAGYPRANRSATEASPPSGQGRDHLGCGHLGEFPNGHGDVYARCGRDQPLFGHAQPGRDVLQS